MLGSTLRCGELLGSSGLAITVPLGRLLAVTVLHGTGARYSPVIFCKGFVERLHLLLYNTI